VYFVVRSKPRHRLLLLEMVPRKEKGRADPHPKDGGPRYTLETYRDDRVEANVRRIVMERTAPGAENLASAPDSLPATQSPRRRAVLRETSMPSAFEYVNYNMPETVPQEVVAGRQVARDMADPGIFSGGPRITDIIHQPPRHAMLSPSVPVQRSSRELSLSRDRATAEDENLAPLPRPYVPRGLVDAFCEPYQHGAGTAFRKETRSEGDGIRPAGGDLQKNLGTATRVANPNKIDFAEVQAAANVLKESDTNLTIGRNEILTTLKDLQRNWYPEESILNKTGLSQQVIRLTQYANREVARLARDMMEEWREIIRVAEGRSPIVVGPDPFVDEGSERYGRIISSQAWDEILRNRQLASEDYNNATTAEIRAAKQRKLGDAGSPELVQGGRNNRRNTDSTITDPDADADADADAMPSGNQSFVIAEVDPSPERPQRSPENNALRARPEDMPLQSVETDATAGLCHECPIFAGTYHHICEGNPQCANLQARATVQRTSPRYGPSRSPQGARRATAEILRDEALGRLRATARFNSASANTGAARNGSADSQRVVTRPVRNPPQVPEGMNDPFASRNDSNRGLGISGFNGRDLGRTNEVSPSQGRKVQLEGIPTVQVSRTPDTTPPRGGNAASPRPRKADYEASTIAELVAELKARGASSGSPASFGKASVITMLMTQDALGNRGNGAPSGLNYGVANTQIVANSQPGVANTQDVANTQTSAGSSISLLDLHSSQAAEPVRERTSARTSPSGSAARAGNKRLASPSNDEPVGKRLRSSRGNRRMV
jgi:hypothetical protein